MAAATDPVFRQFVVKVHSRCNLACDHCYVYEHADQSWRSRPVVMSDETMVWTARRVGEHSRAHSLRSVHVVFHGGEPLLAGTARLTRWIGVLREAMPAGCDLRLGIQTNGILLDPELCELFLAERVAVGISLDGDRISNDRHRRYANGRSSYTAVLEAVRLINQPRYRPVFSGLLCTIDPMNDPLDVYQALADLDPPAIDFLLPHATWDAPPARVSPDATPYADWLLAIHYRWRSDRSPVRVRTFDAIGRLATGSGTLTESLGLDDVDLLVVETDGAIEQADSLKTAFAGAPATGFNVRDHSFDDASAHAGFVARTGGAESLCATCRRCEVVDLCGGGLYAHRFHAGKGFDNPSVYCRDLYRLVDHVRAQPPAVGSPFITHTLAEAHFDELAAGGGGVAAIDALTHTQRSLRREEMVTAVQDVPATDPRGVALHTAWAALCDLDDQAPAAVDRVLAHPYLGIWAQRVADDPVGATYLWGVVLAASLIAGIPWSAKVPLAGRLLPLPTMGAARLREDETDGRLVAIESHPLDATVSLDGRPVPVGDAGERAGDWLPLTTSQLCGSSIAIDDLDPYRDAFHRQASDRLDPGERRRWCDAIGIASGVLTNDLAGHVPAISRGLTTLTPLDAAPTQASATHRKAYGAIGVSATEVPADLADALVLALVHEVQHLKMGAVLDLFPLFDAHDQRRFPVGWREDPRPIEGVLQGAYAHLAVLDVWRHRQDTASGPAQARAASAFATLRDQTRAAIDTLLSSGSLTELGQRWVEHMRAGACGTSS